LVPVDMPIVTISNCVEYSLNYKYSLVQANWCIHHDRIDQNWFMEKLADTAELRLSSDQNRHKMDNELPQLQYLEPCVKECKCLDEYSATNEIS
jgi:hypothetical protein